MNARRHAVRWLTATCAALASASSLVITAAPIASAEPRSPSAMTNPAPTPPHDGAHDFDFELGEWTTELKLLKKPLSGSTTWVEYRGTSTVRPVLGGKANVVELIVEGEAGRIEGASLRLYDPQARQWSLNFFNAAQGQLTAPMVGAFADGRGVFFGQDTYQGRAILVRFVISKVDEATYRFEQAFSEDAGEHWESNWIALDRRK